MNRNTTIFLVSNSVPWIVRIIMWPWRVFIRLGIVLQPHKTARCSYCHLNKAATILEQIGGSSQSRSIPS